MTLENPSENPAVQEVSPQGSKTEKLDAKYDYKISTPQIEKLLARLEQIKESVVEGMSTEEKMAKNADLEDVLDQLDQAAAEREEVLEILQANPGIIHTNSFGIGQYIPKLKSIISRIDEAAGMYYEDPQESEEEAVEPAEEPNDDMTDTPESEQKEVKKYESTKVPANEIDATEADSTKDQSSPKDKTARVSTKKDVFTTISPEIRTYLAALESGATDQLIEEIRLFIEEQTRKITDRRSKIQNTSSKEYIATGIALAKLEDLANKTKALEPKKEQVLNWRQELLVPGAVTEKTLPKRLKERESLSPKEREEAEAEANAKYKAIDLDGVLSPESRELLEKNRDLYDRLRTAVDTYNKKVSDKESEESIKNSFDEIRVLRDEFEDYRDNGSKIDYNRISTGGPADRFYVSPENKMIMENSGFIIKMDEAVSAYNNLIDSNADLKSIKKAYRKVVAVRKEFDKYNNPKAGKPEFVKPPEGKKLSVREIPDSYFEYSDHADYMDRHSDKKHKDYRARTAARTYRDDEFSDGEDVIGKYAEKNTTNPKKSKKVVLSGKPAGEAIPAAASTSTQNGESRIFTMKEGVDYTDLAENIKFNAWLTSMTEAIERGGISVKSQEQDLEDWYDEYEESLPYENKLRAMQEDIKKTEGKNPITVLMTEKKIGDLLFEIHMHGDIARAKIDALFEKFEASQKKAAEIEKIKQTKEFAALVANQRTENGRKIKDLNVEQVKAILETGGEVNARETIEEMVEFLEDIALNYDFYNKSAEDAHDNMYRLYKRHTASEGLRGGKIRWYQKLVPKFFSRMPSNIDQNDFNNFETIIYKIRELDLVDRRIGGKDQAMKNKTKMAKLIRFCKGQESLLAKHMADPKSNKAEEFKDDEEGKELLKIFDKLVKTFADSKYRGEEAKERAEEILTKMSEPSKQKIGDLAPTADIFFEDAAEVEILRKEATRDLTRESLSRMEVDLDRYMKAGIAGKDLAAISIKFDAIEKTLAAYGDGEKDKLATTKMRLKLDELMIKYLKKDTYKELSEAFPALDRIIQSSDKKPEEKKAYITELLTALKKHETNSSNTIVQKAVISDTIRKYMTILSTIK